MVLSVKDLLRDLVKIPSVNPAFQHDEAAIYGESRITDFLENFFENLGLPTWRQLVHPDRENLFAVFRGQNPPSAAGSILWEVHQDTVGVQGMKIDPFAASEAEGRVWGRGACDVKGGMAAMLAAFSRLRAENAAPRQTTVLALTINEESGFSGVKSLARLWGDEAEAQAEGENVRGDLSLDEIRDLRPLRAIVAEPTMLDVVVSHKGCVRWRCHTHGKAAHTSRPEQGRNAISTMVRVVESLQRYQSEVLDQCEPDPRCGGPTVCVSTIQGGSGVNTVPDHAVIDIDYRVSPGDDPDVAREQLIAYVTAANSDESAFIEHEPPSNHCVGLRGQTNSEWAQHIATTVDGVDAAAPTQRSQLIGVPFGTDAWVLDALGIPTVVFGPGSIEQAHTDDEWIDIDQLERATEVFYRLAIDG